MTRTIEDYKPLVEFLGIALGENCEVVLQDVSKEKNCIVAIVNSHISGRKIGSPITDLALKFMVNEEWKDKNYICNYTGKTAKSKILSSSTFFIKDNGKLIGMLCINIDTSRMSEISETLYALSKSLPRIATQLSPEPTLPTTMTDNETETFFEKPEDIIDSFFDNFFRENNVTAERLTIDEKLMLIERLENIGIFRLKGAISYVAEKLLISEPSVYRYRSNILKKPKRA